MSTKRCYDNSEDEATSKSSKFDNLLFVPPVQPLNTKKLPNEVWLKIFQNLSVQDILLNVARVCQHFLMLSKDWRLFKEIKVNKMVESINKYKMFETIGGFKNLQKFTICCKEQEDFDDGFKYKYAEDVSILVWNILKKCPKLKNLKVQDFIGEFDEFDCNHASELINNIAKYGQNLEVLHLDMDNTIVEEPMSALAKLKNLREFHLLLDGYVNSTTDDYLVTLGDNCKNLKSVSLVIQRIMINSLLLFLTKKKDVLEKLDLRINIENGTHRDMITDAISEIKLKSLDLILGGNGLYYADCERIFVNNKMEKLENLMIHVKSFDDTLQIFINKCPGLVNLELLQTRKVVSLEDEPWEFKSIQNTFNRLPNLKKLVLIRHFERRRFDAMHIELTKFTLKEITRKCKKPLKIEVDQDEHDFTDYNDYRDESRDDDDFDGYTKMTITIKEK